MYFFNKHNVGTARKSFFELDYFRPDSKHILSAVYLCNYWVYLFIWLFLLPVVGAFKISLIVPTISFFFINWHINKARLHYLQKRYCESGSILPQNSSPFRGRERRLWDNVEKRHRYLDNNWK